MKRILAISSLLLWQFVFSSVANAEFYSCNFTEPFHTLLISTKYKIATVEVWADRKQSQTVKIDHMAKVGSHLIVHLASGDVITIDRDVIGNDGMSDFYYPHEAVWRGRFGACRSAHTDLSEVGEIERLSSYSNKYGRSLLPYWPGEYGYWLGYKVKKTVKLNADEVRNNLVATSAQERACTLKAGTRYVPAHAATGDKYSHIFRIERSKAHEDDYEGRFQKGDVLTVVGHLAEGYCLIEKSGQVFSAMCPMGDSVDPEVSESDLNQEEIHEVPSGLWLFTQCTEGYRVWIHEKTLDDDNRFQSISIDPATGRESDAGIMGVAERFTASPSR